MENKTFGITTILLMLFVPFAVSAIGSEDTLLADEVEDLFGDLEVSGPVMHSEGISELDNLGYQAIPTVGLGIVDTTKREKTNKYFCW